MKPTKNDPLAIDRTRDAIEAGEIVPGRWLDIDGNVLPEHRADLEKWRQRNAKPQRTEPAEFLRHAEKRLDRRIA